MLPLQVHCVLKPLSFEPVTEPDAQLLAEVPHAPLTGVGRVSFTKHQALIPVTLPLQVHCVLKPLSLTAIAVPVAQLLGTVPQVPLTDCACAGSQHNVATSAYAPSRRKLENMEILGGFDIATAPSHYRDRPISNDWHNAVWVWCGQSVSELRIFSAQSET